MGEVSLTAFKTLFWNISCLYVLTIRSRRYLQEYALCLGIALVSLGASNPVLGEIEMVESVADSGDDWVSFIRNFRERHNFSILVGAGKSRWDVNHFSRISQSSYNNTFAQVEFQYLFHQQIQESLGFALGSSFAVGGEKVDKDSGFSIGTTVQLPGIHIALVQDLSPKWRAVLGLGSYLERVYRIKDSTSEPVRTLDVTLRSQSHLSVAVDFFWKWKSGFRFSFNYGLSSYYGPQKASGLLTDAAFQRNRRWVALGPVYHLE